MVKTNEKNLPVISKKDITIKVKEIERQNNFINELIRNRYHISNTLKSANVDTKKYYVWMKDPKFYSKIQALREQEVDLFEDSFRELVKEKNPQCVIFGLKTRGANRGYQEKQQIEHFGAAAIKIEFGEPGKREEEKKVVDAEEVNDGGN